MPYSPPFQSQFEQRTPEWYQDRLGIPTASMFSFILTPEGKASTSSATYMEQLLADWVAGKQVDTFRGNKFTDIGKEREPETEALYRLLTDNDLQPSNFWFKNDDKMVGASPDGLVNAVGLAEFKNPKASTMIHYLLKKDMPSFYKPQVQGQLWVTGREWCDFMVYHPDIGQKLWHVERDEKYITLLSGFINKFNEKMLVKREALAKYKR